MFNFRYVSVKHRKFAKFLLGIKKIKEKKTCKQMTGAKIMWQSVNKRQILCEHLKKNCGVMNKNQHGTSNTA